MTIGGVLPIINHGLAKSGVDIVKRKTLINDGKIMVILVILMLICQCVKSLDAPVFQMLKTLQNAKNPKHAMFIVSGCLKKMHVHTTVYGRYNYSCWGLFHGL